MKIDRIELVRVRMPLVAPFTTSFGTQTEREPLLIAVHADGVTGWGECVTMTTPSYSSEFDTAAQEVVTRFLAPELFAAGDVVPGAVTQLLEHVKGHRMAKAALEMAVLDAWLRQHDTSFADYLGVTRTHVPAGVSVGIQASLADLVDAVGHYLEQGYRRIKIKIKPGWDLEPVRALRREYGDAMPLQVDANSAYTLADAPALRALDDYGLLLIEQPLYEDDIRLHAELARSLRTPVCLDESIVSARAAADAIALGAAQIMNIKAGRVGGYLEAVRVHDLARAHGVAVWCGGMLETGIGRSANAALAGLPGFTLTGDISASNRFYESDVTEPVELHDGYVAIPRSPGLAPAPLPDVLRSLTLDRVEMRAS